MEHEYHLQQLHSLLEIKHFTIGQSDVAHHIRALGYRDWTDIYSGVVRNDSNYLYTPCYFETVLTLLLLVLAAEDELSDYPMHAIEVATEW